MITCEACGFEGGPFEWPTYFCPNERCEEHNDVLYIEEHLDRERARTMNRADIIEEYQRAGIPFSAAHANAHAWKVVP